MGYGTDSLRQRFTGYLRDEETGLDFAQARYYANSLGRFQSVDPLLSTGSVYDPQTWNRYLYTLNNPLKYIDPLGLFNWAASAGGDLTDEELEAMSSSKSLSRKERKLAKKQLKFRRRVREALEIASNGAENSQLTDEQRTRILGAVNAYGSANDQNGVIIGLGGVATGVGASTRLNDDGTISVNVSEKGKGKDLGLNLAHEGQHVADADAFLANGARAGDVTDLTHRDREIRAYEITSFLAQGLGQKSAIKDIAPKYEVWNKGWKIAERDTKRTRGIDRLVSEHPTYQYTDENPGARYSGEFRQQK